MVFPTCFNFSLNLAIRISPSEPHSAPHHFLTDYIVSLYGRNRVAIIVNKRVRNAVLGCSLKNDKMVSVRFQGKPVNITVFQVYDLTSNAEEAKIEWFYEDWQDLLELTPKKDVLFIIGDWNAKVGSQETPGATGNIGLGVWNEAGQSKQSFLKRTH